MRYKIELMNESESSSSSRDRWETRESHGKQITIFNLIIPRRVWVGEYLRVCSLRLWVLSDCDAANEVSQQSNFLSVTFSIFILTPLSECWFGIVKLFHHLQRQHSDIIRPSLKDITTNIESHCRWVNAKTLSFASSGEKKKWWQILSGRRKPIFSLLPIGLKWFFHSHDIMIAVRAEKML